MKRIVSVSGGLSSFEALRRTIDTHGRTDTIALFADVKGNGASHFFSPFPFLSRLLHDWFGGEARDTYRFLWQQSYILDMPIERIESEKTIWTVFAERRAIRLVIPPRTFFCPASETLKRYAIAGWIQENISDPDIEMVIGMKWDEEHRLRNAQYWWSKALPDHNVTVTSPLMDGVTNAHITLWLMQHDIEIPAAYRQGFNHNNCFGGCVHAGLAHWANLYHMRRNVYLYWSWMEKQIQDYVGKFITILKDQRGGITTPMSLKQFVERIERGDYPRLDFGGCGCFTNAAVATAMIEPQPRQLKMFG